MDYNESICIFTIKFKKKKEREKIYVFLTIKSFPLRKTVIEWEES